MNRNQSSRLQRLPVNASFLTGAYHLRQLPPDEGIEVAFAGRSNVGKSSALNTIAGVRSLARTSKTPGRTQEINFFAIGEQRRLVDLPGYGYAKVSEAKQRHWGHTLEQYLASRHSLAGLVLLMDIRHPLRDYDRLMLDWCRHAGMPVHVLLTKADKLGHGKASAALHVTRQQLAGYPLAGIQLFSSTHRIGVEAVVAQLCEWLELPA